MTTTNTGRRSLRDRAAAIRNFLNRALGEIGIASSEATITDQAQKYWTSASDDLWKCNSHWREGSRFAETDLWSQVGTRHRELFERLARTTGRTGPFGTVLEWGCGGGANAVQFAELGSSFVGVEISRESLDECARQVAAASSVPFQGILIDAAEPEAVVDQLPGPCDLFTCFYVFELLPSQEYGARLVRIASQLLAPGGLAFIQIRYDTGSFYTRPRRRSYRTRIAEMTTYRIDAFWTLAERCGLTPEGVYLVPKNEFDERYAYFLLSKGTTD